MNFIASLCLIGRRIRLFAAIGALFALDPAIAQTSPIQVSQPGEIVAEFSSATAPDNPQLMAASAIKEITAGLTLCAVYVSRDGGNAWFEVPAWPDTGFQPVFDPWVAIGVDGTIHAVGIARTNEGGRAVYTQSRDQGVSWSPALAVTPFPGRFHRRSADKCCLAMTDDGTIYVAFSQVLTSPVGTSELIVARSTDQGLTWITRDTGAASVSNGIVATPGGTVTVAIVGGAVPGYGTITSTDGGDTWGAPVPLGEFNVTQGVPLPSIVYDSLGRIVIGDVGGSTTPQLDVSVERDDGSIAEQWQLPLPDSNTCGSGRLIQPALTGGPNRSPAFQIACKVDPTASTEGSLEVWLYPTVDQPALAPILVESIQLPVQHPPRGFFARRYQDGGDYWSFTWRAAGWLSMWVDPRSAGGPGVLLAAPVTPTN
jgi:hypothetical protein